MNKSATNQEIKSKILQGLELAYVRLLKTKRANNGELVVIRDHKIVRSKP